MKKKIKRFQEGGFTKEQEDWLGGADRTDPYILARMRRAVPDAPKEMPQKASFDTTEGQNKNISDDIRARAMRSVMLDDSPAGKTGYGEENELPTIATKPRKPVAVKTEKKQVVAEKAKEEPKKEPKKGSFLKNMVFKKDVPGGKVSLPKSFSASGGNKEPRRTTARLSPVNFSLPEPLSKIKRQSMNRDLAYNDAGFKKGGAVKSSSASKRADGCAVRGKTRA